MITGGGRILHIPDFSAIGRILAIYPSGSANSSHDGSNTGHSGGGTNSSPPSIALKINNSTKLNAQVHVNQTLHLLNQKQIESHWSSTQAELIFI